MKPSPELTVEPLSRDAWQTLAPRFRDYNYRQAWNYGAALARRHGATCEQIAIRRGEETIAMASVRLKQIPFVGGGIAYVSGGPLTRRQGLDDIGGLTDALRALIAEYSIRRGFLLRILAPVGNSHSNAAAYERFERLGFVLTNAVAGYRTLMVDVARPLNEVRAGLAQKWRNCLNSAGRKDLAVRHGTSDALFAEFCDLFEDFNRRKAFIVDLDARFYRELQKVLGEPDRLMIALAEQDGKVVAGHLSSMVGDTCVYLLGATSPQGLKCKAAYLLQWHTIVSTQSLGMRWYDLGGIAPEENPSVYHFKSGMGGHDVSSPGPFEYTPSQWGKALLVRAAERIYRYAVRTGPRAPHAAGPRCASEQAELQSGPK